jgi:hypothetical protein
MKNELTQGSIDKIFRYSGILNLLLQNIEKMHKL